MSLPRLINQPFGAANRRPLLGQRWLTSVAKHLITKAFYLVIFSLLCTSFLAPAQAQERPAQKAFKGIELYSWQGTNGNWLFALLPGTNRRKAEAEIKRKANQISGTKELEKRLMRVAEGEQVFWFHADLKGFAYPDKKVVDAVISSAKKAKVDLHVPPKGKDNG